MIEVGKKRKTETYGQISEGMFGVSEDDQAHILTILRDKLYSDKVLAVVREYSTNAVDAHVESGQPELPIKVTIPTLTNPKFVVRDFGPGLPEDKIYNLYTKYGASTKRGTNKAIGQLGLGCKSGFAYSDNFTITSYHGGVKSIYHAFIDETNVGKVVKMHEEVSYEPTGMEITIPAKIKDFDTFKERAMLCFAHFDVIPDVKLNIPKKVYTSKGDNWGVRDLNADNIRNANYVIKQALSGAVAIMGNIAYPISTKQIPGLKPEETELLRLPVEIKFGIGALSISASREALEYTERTQRMIKAGIRKVVAEFKAKTAERFIECNNAWEARKVWRSLYDVAWKQQRSEFARAVLKTFSTWNGVDISNQSFNYDAGPKNIRASYISKGLDSPHKSIYGRNVSFSENPIFVINDTKSAWVKKCLALRQSIEDKTGVKPPIVAIRYQEPIPDPQIVKVGYKPPAKPKPVVKEPVTFEEGIEAYIKKHGLEGAEFVKLSELPKAVLDLIANNKLRRAVPPRKKIKGAAFKLEDPTLSNPNYRPSESWSEAEVELEDGEGIYITIHGFYPTDIEGTNDRWGYRRKPSQEFVSMMNALKSIGIDPKTLPVYGFRSKLVPKLGKKWVHFGDYFDKVVSDWVEKEKISQKVVDMREYDNAHKLNDIFAKAIVDRRNQFDDKDEFIIEYCEKFLEFHKNFSNVNGNIREKLKFANEWIDRKKLDVKVKPSYELSKNYATLKYKYPLLSKAGVFGAYHKPGNMDLDIYIDYCNKCKR